VQQNPDLEI